MTKQFPLRVVLTVTTGRLLTAIGDVYDILNWITGDNLFTHELARALNACRPWLLKCFPELAAVEERVDRLDACIEQYGAEKGIESWLAQAQTTLPEIKDSYDVQRMPDGWVSIDPVLELESMIGKDRVITVKAPK